MLKDLSALTPPFLVAAAFLIAVGAFVRHEMGARGRRRDADTPHDISADTAIPWARDQEPSARSDDGEERRGRIGDGRPEADYGELREHSGLPPGSAGVELGSRIGVDRIGESKSPGISFNNSPKGLLQQKGWHPWLRRQ